MKAFVTGGTGFLGSRLAKRLVQAGWDVSASGRNEEAGASLEREGIRFVRADLRDDERIAAACAGQDAVFHCGALSSLWGPYREFYDCNVRGTEHVIAGCRRHGVGRLVYVSTPSVYYDGTHRFMVTESSPLPAVFANAYAHTKRLAELAVDRAHDAGLPAIILRPRAIFGPGDRTILPRFIRANRSFGVPLFGGGNIEMDLTYVDNVVEALVRCSEAPRQALGRTFNITNGEPVRFIDVVERLFAMLDEPLRLRPMPYRAAYLLAAAMEAAAKLRPGGSEPQLTRYSVGLLGRSQTLDITAARTVLGYRPRIGIEAGLEAFAEWWMS